YIVEDIPEMRTNYQLASGGIAPKRELYKAKIVSASQLEDNLSQEEGRTEFIQVKLGGGPTYFDVIPHTLQQLTRWGATTTDILRVGGITIDALKLGQQDNGYGRVLEINNEDNDTYLQIGAGNDLYAHYSTNAQNGHWFREKVYFNNNITAFSNNWNITSEGNAYFQGSLHINQQANGIKFSTVSNSQEPVYSTGGSMISGGSDYAGLDKLNNVAVQTWYGFSVNSIYTNGSIPAGKAAFAVDARSGKVYAANGYYVGTQEVWHRGNDGEKSGLDADLWDGEHRPYGFGRALNGIPYKVGDADELLTVGETRFLQPSSANLPSQAGYMVKAFLGGDMPERGAQLAMSYSQVNGFYVRNMIDKEWKKIYHSGNSNNSTTDWNANNLEVSGFLHTRDIRLSADGSSVYALNRGNDYAGLDKINNINLDTWWGFSIRSSYNAVDEKPRFSVDARTGNVYAEGRAYFGGSLEGGTSLTLKESDTRYMNLNVNGSGNYFLNAVGMEGGNYFGLQVNGSSKLFVTENGNLGINVIPEEKLEVGGNIKASGNIKLFHNHATVTAGDQYAESETGYIPIRLYGGHNTTHAFIQTGGENVEGGLYINKYGSGGTTSIPFFNVYAEDTLLSGNLTVNGEISGSLKALDVTTSSGSAYIRVHDLRIGHPYRKEETGRALVDYTDTLILNYSEDWAKTEIGGEAIKIRGNVGIKTSASSSYSLYVNGQIHATVSSATSDLRLKKDIDPVENVLDKVMQMNPIRYRYKEDPEENLQVGFGAQEVGELFPELVSYAEDLDRYGLYYNGMVAMNTAAIQETNRRFDQQHQLIEKQQREIQELQQVIKELTAPTKEKIGNLLKSLFKE
ncbi:tail fiber domain-containing protein, partial [Xanthovirga aplysinae]|uniref:tail fiber domain-containing protein n=1 Tax=Xanthovirga aplysinae TaxID=2529853 RepID=UPI001CA39300